MNSSAQRAANINIKWNHSTRSVVDEQSRPEVLPFLLYSFISITGLCGSTVVFRAARAGNNATFILATHGLQCSSTVNFVADKWY